MSRHARLLGWVVLGAALIAAPAHAAPATYGRLSGTVVDPAGTPQMGASVLIVPEVAANKLTRQFLTNQNGFFVSERLVPGEYTVRVTLAGFLPSIQRHVRVTANLTTLLRIEMGSLFASLDRLRRRADQSTEPDDWKWVLRSASATRPVLQWLDGEVRDSTSPAPGESPRRAGPHARIELTAGALRPGSVSNLADAPATAFAYDQRVGSSGRLLFAGQMSYERSAAGGVAVKWVPSGQLGMGPETTLVLRQAKLGPDGPTFRGMRAAHSSSLALGDRIEVHYGAEYDMVGLGRAASALRPRAEIAMKFAPGWRGSFLFATLPPQADLFRTTPLQSSLAELDGLPTVLWRNGRPVLEGGWHQELSLERKLGSRASILAAAFRDSAGHVAVFGRGATPGPDFFVDNYSGAFSYDGGRSSSWGGRIAYREKFSDDFDLAVVYAWAGALAAGDSITGADLRDMLVTRQRQSLAARVSARAPKFGTRVAASYKWVQGNNVSRQDRFGEAAYLLDPFLNLSIRQPLPGTMAGGKWEALADFRNLLAQGYVTIAAQDGQLVLLPAVRSFRGGFTFQF